VREDRECLPFAVLLLDLGQQFLPLDVVTQEQDGRFRERPLQMHVAHLRAAGAELLAAGLLAAFDEPGRVNDANSCTRLNRVTS
jgi:hypothetical protein